MKIRFRRFCETAKKIRKKKFVNFFKDFFFIKSSEMYVEKLHQDRGKKKLCPIPGRFWNEFS